MEILTVNVGSSSVRMTLFEHGPIELKLKAKCHFDRKNGTAHKLLHEFIEQARADSITRVAHRVVHGGEHLKQSCLITSAIEQEISRLEPLAPLHNPIALEWILACREALGKAVAQIAVFDTAFFVTLPQVASMYALPRELSAKYGLRRFGFHGLAHQAQWSHWRALRPDVVDGGRVISIQLGAGCSITAIDRGRAMDTSMGFSPLEGLVMATRSGDVDPGLLTFIQREESLTPSELDQLLNEASGLLGVSGLSGDMRTLISSTEPNAQSAIDLYCYRVRKYVGAYLAVLGGADAILIGGGVGEHAAIIRKTILSGFEWAGISLDLKRNQAKEASIHASDSTVQIWVISVDEARVLAEQALTVSINDIRREVNECKN